LRLKDQNKSNFLIEEKRKEERGVSVGDSGICRDIRACLLSERSDVITPDQCRIKIELIKVELSKIEFTDGNFAL